MNLMIRNMSSYIMKLSPKTKERLRSIQNYLLVLTPWKELLTMLHFVVCGSMRPGYLPLPTRIIRKPRVPSQSRPSPSDIGGGFKIVIDDGGIY